MKTTKQSSRFFLFSIFIISLIFLFGADIIITHAEDMPAEDREVGVWDATFGDPQELSVKILEEAKAYKPQLSIRLPGLDFDNYEIFETTAATHGDKSWYIPWISLFIYFIYKFLLVISSIVGMIMIIITAAKLLISGGEEKAATYKRIGNISIGLIIAWSSYAILNLINPALVENKPMKVTIIPEHPLSQMYEGNDDSLPSSGAGEGKASKRTYKPKNYDDFCFPISEGFDFSAWNWGGGRAKKASEAKDAPTIGWRCHKGLDLFTHWKSKSGKVVSMTDNARVITVLSGESKTPGQRFTTCNGGISDRSNEGRAEDAGAVYVRDDNLNIYIVYGELNAGSIPKEIINKTKKILKKGDFIGTATKRQMLHLEIYEGTSIVSAGWEFPLEANIGVGKTACITDTYLQQLDNKNSTLRDPSELIKKIMGQKCPAK